MQINYTISKELENKDLKLILKNELFISSNLIIKLKNTNSIFVNNKPIFINYIVKFLDIITIDFENMKNHLFDTKCKTKFLEKYSGYNIPFDIIYEDEFLLIINKPQNMPVHPSFNDHEHTLCNIVAPYFEKQHIYTMHIITRLDKDTTGVCIFAKNEYIQELFIRKKEILKFTKEYIAIVNNIILDEQNTITLPIARKNNSIIEREVSLYGDFAKTQYFVQSRNFKKNYTVISILLHTGRTHQIRVHMSYINHTILGDDMYAKNSEKDIIQKYILRQALHAYKVSFIHPITAKLIVVNAKIPNDMLALM